MTLRNFTKEFNFKLNKNSLRLCREASKILKRSKDALHGQDHVSRMIKMLSEILSKHPTLRKKIDLETIILSIFWHDAWKAFRRPTNALNFLTDNYYEGYGSATLFRKYALKMRLKKSLLSGVTYAIKKHPNSFFLPKTIEGKILQDLDEVELWNFKRIISKDNIFNSGKFFRFLQRLYYKIRAKRRLHTRYLDKIFTFQKNYLLKRI
jgi:hypothetical protein